MACTPPETVAGNGVPISERVSFTTHRTANWCHRNPFAFQIGGQAFFSHGINRQDARLQIPAFKMKVVLTRSNNSNRPMHAEEP
jgi:hypothetical protein